MGQLSLSSSPQSGFQAGNWVEAIEDNARTLFPNINPYRNRLLMNKETAELVEQYELQFISQNDFDSFLGELQLRKESKYLQSSGTQLNRTDQQFRNSPYIYKVRYFENLSVKELCSTVYHGRLYINKVDVRLKQLNDIPFYDQLYLYYVCLAGFKILYEKVGVFQINEQMIFFDKQGQVRVWMNPNLSSFQPNYEPEDYNNQPAQNQGSQSEMLKNLMNIIEQNTDKQSVANQLQFKEYLIDKGLFERLSFSKAIQYFGAYCEQNQLSVSRYMCSIYELFHQDESLKRSLAQSSQVNKVIYNKHFDSINHLEVQKTLQKTSDPERRQNYLHTFASPESNFKEHYRNSSQYIGDSQPYIKNRDSKQQVLKSASLTPKYSQQQTSNTHNHQLSPTDTTKNRNQLKRSNYHQKNQNSALIAIIPPADSRKVIVLSSPQQSINTNSNFSYKSPEPNLANSKNSNRGKSLGRQQVSANITFIYKDSKSNEATFKDSKSNDSKSNEATFTQPVNHFYSFMAQDTSKPRKQSIIDKLQPGTAEKELLKKVGIETNQVIQSLQRDKVKAYNYYSSNGQYALDKEIADDMIKYLGFNPNI